MSKEYINVDIQMENPGFPSYLYLEQQVLMGMMNMAMSQNEWPGYAAVCAVALTIKVYVLTNTLGSVFLSQLTPNQDHSLCQE